MDLMIGIIAIIYFGTAAIVSLIWYKKYFLSPQQIFLLSQTMMFLGILRHIDLKRDADVLLVFIYFIAQIFFIAGVEISSRIWRKDCKTAYIANRRMRDSVQKERIYILIALSIIACSYLFIKAGNNIFLAIIKETLGGAVTNHTEMRLSFYQIRGVGYVYQFRVIILPLLTLFMILTVKKNKIISLGLGALMLVFILGTGQRGGFVMFVLMAFVTVLILNKLYCMNLEKKIIGGLALAGVLFMLMTIGNGRNQVSGGTINALIDRFTSDNQYCAVIGFRYIFEHPVQWGKDWFLMAKDILPGKSDYVPLETIIFEIIYGSRRGTSPPCVWGSVYYNFGMLGIMVFPVLLGGIYQYLYSRLYQYPVTTLRIVLYSGLWVVCGMWIASSPVYFFNQGGISIVILMYLLHIDRKMKKKQEILMPEKGDRECLIE